MNHSHIKPISQYTEEDIDAIEDFWVKKSRVNFLAYRKYMRGSNYVGGWFMDDLCKHIHKFYVDYSMGKRPILVIKTPPQHGKSWIVSDLITWFAGKSSTLRMIYASYSELLGIRCNTHAQRFFDSPKFQKVFPNFGISKSNTVTVSHRARRNSNHIEFMDSDGVATEGQLRNTTVAGPVTGESLDIGFIDDAVKGRAEANSITLSQKTWEWFTDDFGTRFADHAGLIVIMTPWTTHDLVGRIEEVYKGDPRLTIVNYPAIATKDEKYRKIGEPLFPKLKSLEFLESRKQVMPQPSWESLYQCSPTVTGGNIFKDHWWGWYKDKTPPLKYKFITADTAQKKEKRHDFAVFQCWGYAIDDRIYLLDKLRAKLEAPGLRMEAEAFYRKHDLKKEIVTDPLLRGMYIEDKSSGTGLIQELRKVHCRVVEVPRNKNKDIRGDDAAQFVQAGCVVLSTQVDGVGNLTKEAREFPNSEFDDDIDTLMTAVEITYINKTASNSLLAAMEAD